MNRRTFFRSIATVALAMRIGLPPLKIKQEAVKFVGAPYWTEVTRLSCFSSPEYTQAIRKILNESNAKLMFGKSDIGRADTTKG